MTYSDIDSERNSCGIIRKNMKFTKYLERNCSIDHMRVQERYRGHKKSREIERERTKLGQIECMRSREIKEIQSLILRAIERDINKSRNGARPSGNFE